MQTFQVFASGWTIGTKESRYVAHPYKKGQQLLVSDIAAKEIYALPGYIIMNA